MKGPMGAATAALLLLILGHVHAADVIPCDPSDSRFVCGMRNPEDVVHLPGTSWAVATSLNVDFSTLQVRGVGPLRAIDVRARASHTLFPARDSATEWDEKTYPDCSSPPHPFTSHGLDVQPLGRGSFRLYVANHGERESVEVVDVAVRGKTLRATWRGCVKVPSELQIWPNAVAALPSGGFVLSGNNVALWHPGRGWKKIRSFHGVPPGQDRTDHLGFANGVAVSRDGQWIFVADTTRDTVSRFSVSGDEKPTIVKIDFSPGYFWPDNLHWGDDGALYLAGPYSTNKELPGECYLRAICDEIGIGIARIDIRGLSAQIIYRSPGMPHRFGAATTALKLGDRFWIGSTVGDRIAVVKAEQ